MADKSYTDARLAELETRINEAVVMENLLAATGEQIFDYIAFGVQPADEMLKLMTQGDWQNVLMMFDAKQVQIALGIFTMFPHCYGSEQKASNWIEICGIARMNMEQFYTSQVKATQSTEPLDKTEWQEQCGRALSRLLVTLNSNNSAEPLQQQITESITGWLALLGIKPEGLAG